MIYGIDKSERFDELVSGEGPEAALGGAVAAVVGAAHPLEEGGDAAGGAHLADQLDGADVDAQLQRGGGHQGLEVAGSEAMLGADAALGGQGAVVSGHRVVTQALGQLMGDALGESAGVDEHDGGVVLADELGHAVEDLVHLGVGDHGLEFVVDQLQADVEVPLVAGVDDGAVGAGVGVAVDAGEEVGDGTDGMLGGRQADSGGAGVGDVL